MKRITLDNYTEDKLYPRIVAAAHDILLQKPELRPTDVFRALDYLQDGDYKRWRSGRVPYLEKVIRCNLGKANRVLRILRFHAHDLNLRPHIARYTRKSSKGKRLDLRFSKTGHPRLEEAYARHFAIVGRVEKFRQKLLAGEEQSKGEGERCMHA